MFFLLLPNKVLTLVLLMNVNNAIFHGKGNEKIPMVFHGLCEVFHPIIPGSVMPNLAETVV